MTVSTTACKVIALGNGATTVFNYTFLINLAADALVIFTSAAGVETILGPSLYSITGLTNPAGGTVTYPLIGSPIASGTKLTIARNAPDTQLTDLVSQGSFSPDVVETGLDDIVLQVQQLAEKASRSVTIPISDTIGLALQLPSSANRASKFLAFDFNGDAMAISGTPFTPVVTSIITQTPTGFFFAQNGARINRINDRLFIGPATLLDGAFPSTNADYLSTLIPNVAATTQLYVLSSVSGAAIIAGTRTSDGTGASFYAGGFYGINDQTDATKPVWAIYAEAHHFSGALLSEAAELEVVNYGPAIATDPYNVVVPGSTICLVLGSGAEHVGKNDATAALYILNNLAAFETGIVFGATAITGANGVTGEGEAIGMALGHRLNWHFTGGGIGAGITSLVTVAASSARIKFTDTGLQYSVNGVLNLFLPVVASAVNWISLKASVAGSPVEWDAAGGDTNIGIKLTPKGTGLLQLGNAASFAANGAVATVLGSLGPAGSHTTVQKWLAVRDSGGTTLWIPAF